MGDYLGYSGGLDGVTVVLIRGRLRVRERGYTKGRTIKFMNFPLCKRMVGQNQRLNEAL